jgi:phosphoglycolate phosphatase
MKYIDLLIFDLDGTLIDSKEAIADAVNFSLKEVGLREKTVSEINSYIGRGLEDLLRRSLGEGEGPLLKKALYLYKQYYAKHCTDKSILYPNVKKTLDYFKNKRKIIVTNSNYELARIILTATGIGGYFEEIIGGDDVGCLKPFSCHLDMLTSGFNIDKQRAMIIGDMDIDILAGKRAGIITCGVTYGIGRKEDILKAKPDFIIDNLLDLKKIINQS